MVDPQEGPQAPHLVVQATEVEDGQDMAIEDLVVIPNVEVMEIVVQTKVKIEPLMATMLLLCHQIVAGQMLILDALLEDVTMEAEVDVTVAKGHVVMS